MFALAILLYSIYSRRGFCNMFIATSEWAGNILISNGKLFQNFVLDKFSAVKTSEWSICAVLLPLPLLWTHFNRNSDHVWNLLRCSFWWLMAMKIVKSKCEVSAHLHHYLWSLNWLRVVLLISIAEFVKKSRLCSFLRNLRFVLSLFFNF